jgi:hypothetical protein
MEVRLAAGILVLVMLVENFRHVSKQPQRHRWVWGALVLEKQIEHGLPVSDKYGKQQV